MNLEAIITGAGYPAIFLLVMADCMGIPMPGETARLIAAGAAGTGTAFNIWGVIAAATAGAIVGDTIGYWIGRRGGRPLLQGIMKRFGIRQAHLEKAETFFARHGAPAVFFGRSFSYLRVLTALLAGVSRMRYPQFLFFNILGGIVWACVVGFAGYTCGKNLGALEIWIRETGWALLALLLIYAAVWYLLRRNKLDPTSTVDGYLLWRNKRKV